VPQDCVVADVIVSLQRSRFFFPEASRRHARAAARRLAAWLKANYQGDTLVFWKLEKLHTRAIRLKMLAGAGAPIDTTIANGWLAFGIFAKFEGKLIAMAGLPPHAPVGA
jgi:hypothetical protein